MGALAEDHINDVMSNLGALLAAVVAKAWPAGWWVDGAAAVLIAAVILVRWSFITVEQARRGQGRGRRRGAGAAGVHRQCMAWGDACVWHVRTAMRGRQGMPKTQAGAPSSALPPDLA